MLRRSIVAVAVVALASGSLLAAEIRGTLKKIEPSRNCIIVTVADQDRTIEMSPKAPVYSLVSVGRPRRATVQLQQTGQGMQALNALQPGTFVTVQTQNRDGIETATEIREDSVSTSSGRRRLRR